jgi:hypothetical protein
MECCIQSVAFFCVDDEAKDGGVRDVVSRPFRKRCEKDGARTPAVGRTPLARKAMLGPSR